MGEILQRAGTLTMDATHQVLFVVGQLAEQGNDVKMLRAVVDHIPRFRWANDATMIEPCNVDNMLHWGAFGWQTDRPRAYNMVIYDSLTDKLLLA